MAAADEVLAEARRKYDLQLGRLNGFRSGSATLLAAGGIVAGLFGTRLTRHGIGFWRSVSVVVALVAFLGLVVVAIAINWPKQYDEGEKLDRWLGFIQNRDPLADAFMYNLAKALNESYNDNQAIVTQAAGSFTWACVLLGVEVVGWTAATLL